MKISVSKIALVFFIALPMLSCAAQPMGQARNQAHIGIGRDRLAEIARDMIGDMRLFFSKQLVFKSSEDCPARIMIDAQKFNNESAERIDFARIVKALRDHLNDRDHAQHLSLAGRQIALVDNARRVIAGASRFHKCKTEKKLGADYVLAARIISEDKISQDDIRQRQTLLTFWLLDLETSAKAWSSKAYLVKSYGQNDVVYR